MGIKRFFGIFNKLQLPVFTQLSFRHLIFFSLYITDLVFNIIDQGIQNVLLIDVIISLTVITVAFFPVLITVLPFLAVGPFLMIGDPFPPFVRPFLSMLIPTSVVW